MLSPLSLLGNSEWPQRFCRCRAVTVGLSVFKLAALNDEVASQPVAAAYPHAVATSLAMAERAASTSGVPHSSSIRDPRSNGF